MDQKIKRRWVKALRSGKYQQGRNQLMRSTRMCCMGVLCDIQPGAQARWSGSFLPPENLLAGLDSEDCDILATANDRYKWSFDDIATYIEVML